MPFLRETSRSLRAYFLIVGALASLLGIWATVNAVSHPAALLIELIVIAPILVNGLVLLYAGIRFHPLLETRPHVLEQLLYVTIGMVCLRMVGDVMSRLDVLAIFLRAFFSLALALYLLTNVRRLAREAAPQR